VFSGGGTRDIAGGRDLRPADACLAETPYVAARLVLFGMAVVSASFLLAWAAEAAQVDISGGLAIAILAVIAVLPEYFVDLYFAYTAGSNPAYVAYAAANMTGSNRLLLGLGWSSVVLVALAVAKKRSGKSVRELTLESGYRVELGFLAIASVVAFFIPISGQIPLLALVRAARVLRVPGENPLFTGTNATFGQPR
jgi:cation:H+ antiporter